MQGNGSWVLENAAVQTSPTLSLSLSSARAINDRHRGLVAIPIRNLQSQKRETHLLGFAAFRKRYP